MPAEAEAVHGLSTAFLVDKPLFAAVAQEFLEFVGEDVLVIHNATFDIGFLNHELGRLGKGAIPMTRVVDTLQLARRKHPAGPNSLDALCKRYGIDNSKRIKHGALMDSLLLAEVYIELLGERQAMLGFGGIAGSAPPRAHPKTGPRALPAASLPASIAAFGGDRSSRTGLSCRRSVPTPCGAASWSRPTIDLAMIASGLPVRSVNRRSHQSSDCVSWGGWRPRLAAGAACKAARSRADRAEGREAAFAGDVGDKPARERKNQRRAIDEQERLERRLGNVTQPKHPHIHKLEVVDRGCPCAWPPP